MNRVEAAISEGRCVLALGSQLLRDPEILMEIRRRPTLAMVVLGGDPMDPTAAISAESVAPCLDHAGGLLVLVEPDPTQDARGLNMLAEVVQKGRNKPRICVAARAFNPFTLPMSLRMLKLEQERRRARDFLGLLPAPPAAPAPAPVAAPPVAVLAQHFAQAGVPEGGASAAPEPQDNAAERAPRVGFSGREDELATLASMLGDGGPIVIHGPAGIGRRWLIERCLEGSPLRRLPDVVLSWSSGADALYARLAQAAQDNGDKRLAKALRKPTERPSPLELAELAVESLRAPGLSDVVMVIYGLERLMRDDGTMHRRGRLELLLEALLANSYAPRLLFTSALPPRSYTEGGGAALRLLGLEGLKGRELYEIFDAYRFSDVARDRMGEVHQATHGHPLATRTMAVAARSAKEPAALMEDPRKILKLESLADTEPLARRLRRRLDRLPEAERKALATLAHLQLPASTDLLQRLGVGRNERLTLLAKGLLDSTPSESERLYYVHPLVASQLNRREITDFNTYEAIGNAYLEVGRRAPEAERLHIGLEANRCLVLARRARNCVRLGYPDQDAEIETVRGLLRAQRPRLDIAEQRLSWLLKAEPRNTEALLLWAEGLTAAGAPEEKIQEAYRQAAEQAPTPEVFHLEANWQQKRGRSGDLEGAIDALQRGALAFPKNGRIRRRLAGLLLDAHKVEEATALLEETLAIEPMMPDTYGLLGQILTDRGPAAWARATEYVEEALRLSPEDPVHLVRMGRLLRLRGTIERAEQESLWERAIEHFERAIADGRRNHDGLLELATLLLDKQGPVDLDRVTWLLKQAGQGRGQVVDKILEARLAARRDRLAEAEAVLERLVLRDPKNHRARAALGEVLYGRKRIFRAFAEYRRAQQDAPPESLERHTYESVMAQLQALIESGQAIELERLADEEALAAPPPPPPIERPPSRRRERGRGRERGAPHAGPDAGADIATEPAVPAEADDGAGDQAPEREVAGEE
ncbi:MAG: tetratricopeptide repeat protein [Pseudomonadota bacterium]